MRVNSFISNFKTYMKRILGIVLLLVILCSIFQKYMDLTRTGESSRLYDFYHYVDNDTIDVLCIGSSHVGRGINPVQMWDDYGISAYSMWGGAQSVWFSYYYLEEALKTQTPQIVIFDIFTVTLALDDSYFDSKIPLNLLTLEPSFTKYKALKTAGAENLADLLFTFPVTHARYKELNQGNFDERDTCVLGYDYTTYTEPCEILEDVHLVKETLPISEKSEMYIRKAIEICEKKGIKIILTNTPWPEITKEKQMQYNYVGEIAKEYDVPFINGCLYSDEMGIDYATDSSGDGGHLNHYGVTKYTTWLENYLVENYSLENHKGNEKYRHWEEASIRLNKTIKLEKQMAMSDFEEYVSSVLNDDYNYTVLLYNGKQDDLSVTMKSVLDKFGIVLEAPSLYIIENNQVVYSAPLSENYEYCEYREKRIFNIVSDGKVHIFKINGNVMRTVDESGPLMYIYSYDKLFGMGTWNTREIMSFEQ